MLVSTYPMKLLFDSFVLLCEIDARYVIVGKWLP